MEQTGTIKHQAKEIVENVWDVWDEVPSGNDDVTNFGKLLIENPHVTIEDIEGIIMWMAYVNNDQYWLKRITGSADFVRAFRKIYDQYTRCGGYKTAQVAARLAHERVQAATEDMETFRVEDVDETDGLS
jgi:hypothetical protein